LIARLDSDKFKERQDAARRLVEIGPASLGRLRKVAATTESLELRRRVELLIGDIENGEEALAEEYRAYELPLPPPGAKLVLRGERRAPQRYRLAFLIERHGPRLRSVVLSGTWFVEAPKADQVVALHPATMTAEEVGKLARRLVFLNAGEGLVVALQCKARGHEALARVIFTASARQLTGESPREALASEAWSYWHFNLTNADIDLCQVDRQLRRALALDKRLQDKKNLALLRSVKLALRPSKARPGSVEALIDGLVNLDGEKWRRWPMAGPSDSAYRRLADKGFEAIPALIEHLHDERITRSGGMVGFTGQPYYHNDRVRDIVGCLLSKLAGNGADDWPQSFRNPAAGKAVRAWWEKAKRNGEEVYFAGRVFETQDGSPNREMLRVLTIKYPHRLPELYRRLLAKHPMLDNSAVVEAVAGSSLPRRERVELLLEGAKRKDLQQRHDALEGLKALDRKLFIERLVATLDALPRTPAGEYGVCPEARFGSLLEDVDEPRVWRALAGAARRGDPGLRLEILRGVWVGEAPNERSLQFLAAFLNDATVRDVTTAPGKYNLFAAASTFRKIEVRNFAAWELARALGLKATPEPDWSAEQWAAFRDRVRKALPR
jgi:hypothetical protein